MDILGTLFGSRERVRIMRYVIANEDKGFDIKMVVDTTGIDSTTVRKEINLFKKATLVKEKVFTKETVSKRGETTKTKTNGFILDKQFPYLSNFKNLLLEKEDLAPTELYEQFKKFGKIELFLVTGIFQGRSSRELDILIVGKSLKKAKIEEKIAEIESSVGSELKYAIFDSEEFAYRYMMYDRFVRETLHHDHVRVVDTLSIG